MKKTFIAAVLALATLTATAGVTGSIAYDYDRSTGNGWSAAHTATTGLKFGLPGALGAVDVNAVGRQLVTNVRNNVLGYEVGYSNGLTIGAVSLTGRVAYRSISTDVLFGGGIGNTSFTLRDVKSNTTKLGVEASIPAAFAGLTPFVGYERLMNDNSSSTVGNLNNRLVALTVRDNDSNRYTVGADMALTKSLSARLGYARTTTLGKSSNGVTTAVSYAF